MKYLLGYRYKCTSCAAVTATAFYKLCYLVVPSACPLPSCAKFSLSRLHCPSSLQADVMLVKNAQNLMQAVVKTVQAAESACMKVNSLHVYRLLYVIKESCSSCMKVSSNTCTDCCETPNSCACVVHPHTGSPQLLP